MVSFDKEGSLAIALKSDTPSAVSATITAPGVLLRDFAILSRPFFCFEKVLRVFTSSFDQATRVSFALLRHVCSF